MKKLFCMILTLSLVSCTQPETEFSQTPSTTETEIRLVCADEMEKIEYLTKAFEKENPEIKITVITTDPNDDFALATKALLSGQQNPTIILTKAEYLYDLLDYFANLSNEVWVNNALPNTFSEVSREGQILAMPAEIEGIGFVYDKRVFEAANINPENINSLDRLIATAEHLSAKLSKLKKEFSTLNSIFATPDEQTEKYLLNIVLSQEYSSSFEVTEKESELSCAESYTTLLTLLQNYSSDKQNAHAVIALQSHKMVGNTANFDMLPVPVLGASQDSIILNVPTYWAVNKSATKEEQKAAKSFLSWVYTSEAGNTLISETLGLISPFDNATKIPDTPIAKTIRRYAISGKTMPYLLNGLDQEIYNKIKADLPT